MFNVFNIWAVESVGETPSECVRSHTGFYRNIYISFPTTRVLAFRPLAFLHMF